MTIVNALTIDFEDWFCVNNLSASIKFEDWDKCESRIENNTSRILDLLEKYNVKATFFVLGWLAERVPELIKTIEQNGHEIASHGYSHISLSKLTKSDFEVDLKRALQITEQIIQKRILGYRSPSFSITSATSWAFEILVNNGITYDSSVFPLSYHPDYGYRGAETIIHSPINGLLEIPLNVLNVMGLKIPFGGGGYFRLYPHFISNFMMKNHNKKGLPFVFYLHPWEIDHYQPRQNVPMTKKFRHYYNLKNTLNKFEKVLKQYSFTTIQHLIAD